MSQETNPEPADESNAMIVDSVPKYSNFDESLELVQDLVNNAGSDGGLIPVYIWDQNPDDPDEGLDLVVLVHPHWSKRMIADHLRKQADRIVDDPSDDTSFSEILWPRESDG